MNETLKAEIVGGKLSITIDVDSLIKYVTLGGAFDCFPDDPIVTDKMAFAQEILGQLTMEAEDGSTPLHRMIDKAAIDAVENGCEGIE